MGKEVIDALVKGGAASAGPPLGPSLGALKINVAEVIKEINAKTEAFKGMEVPVKVIIIDTETKKFIISVGTPPVTAMIKKELGVQKLAIVDESKKRKTAGNLSMNSVINIAQNKTTMAGDLKARVKQVLGTCQSSGVTVEGKVPKEMIKEIDEKKIQI